mmetsp:Transcript_12485/g.11057  ORF Transcript_12485/g.11057 Transcript_12485/m.11057 type:complete len:144 (+) Transcript_12485:241-672(+)
MLFSTIRNIRRKRVQKNSLRTSTRRSVLSLSEINERQNEVQARRKKYEMQKRKKYILFLKNNKLLKEKKHQEFMNKIKENFCKKRSKMFLTQITLLKILKELNSKLHYGQIQRDNVKKHFQSFFIVKLSFNRFIKKSWPKYRI